MGQFYEIPLEFTYNAANAPMDIIEIVAPTDAVIKIHEIIGGQSDSEISEALVAEIYEGYTASGSGGSSVTPDPVENGYSAAGGTYETGNTTPANTGGTKRGTIPFNALNGLHMLPTPEIQTIISPGQRWVLHLPIDPDNALTWEGKVIVEEIGG